MSSPIAEQAYTTHSGHGSVGPVIGVLAVIIVLGVLSAMIGRLCSGRRVMGRKYDIEAWVETKCSSCIDGSIATPPPPPPPTPPPPETEPAEDSPPDKAPQ